MICYPAIDIRGGRAVRLVQGDYARETAFDADPVDAARRWVEQGAQWLHVVDLDGAREGRSVNLEVVARIVAEAGVPVQLGGGLRDADAVEAALETGAARVVLGTVALRDPLFVRKMLDEHGVEAIVVSLDARGRHVAIEGWATGSQVPVETLAADLVELGVTRFVFTPIEVDGTLAGPGLDDLRVLSAVVEGELIYSGGVGSLDDLRALAGLDLPNLGGAIVGRALYEERFTVGEGQSALSGS